MASAEPPKVDPSIIPLLRGFSKLCVCNVPAQFPDQ